MINYYIGAYGPTIRIDVYDHEVPRKLQTLFRDLAEGRRSSARLGHCLDLQVLGMTDITLQVDPKARRFEQTVFLISRDQDLPTYAWISSPEVWDDLAEFIQPFLAGEEPRHQYLSAEGQDDALIELAFRETASLAT